LPVLTKADMRGHFPAGLMPDQKDPAKGLESGEIEYTYTSGTTSERVVNIWDQDWWDRSEASSWKLNRHTAALPYPQKQAKLASALNVGISCEEDLPMSHRILGSTLYLNEKISILQWQPRHLKRMADEMNAYRPLVLEANSSLLARLAYWAIDNGVGIFSPRVIIFTFEYQAAIHLTAIKQVFSSALVSSYGGTETGFVLEQCEKGLMHQNTDFCRIDFEPLKDQFGGPELGRIFVTTFDNPWNCIIRFDTGDLVRLHPHGECACGRAEGMIVSAVEGRVSNVTFGSDGRLITTKMLDDALSAIGELRDYHFEQDGKSSYTLEAMLSPCACKKEAEDRLHCILEKIFGKDGEFTIKIVDSILPGPAGKFRRTHTNFEFNERELFT
jgi:phenylacetate-coenzyme A ligase PaaK-like adenylate-forming protein